MGVGGLNRTTWGDVRYGQDMPEHEKPQPVKAESQMRTWLAVTGVGLLMLIAGRGTYWEPFGQLGLFLTVVGIGGMLWLLAKGRDERQQ